MEGQDIKWEGDRIIRHHMKWSMGAGLIPLPIVDLFAVTAIQLDMIRQLCRLYNVPFSEKDGRAIVTSLTGASSARFGANLVKAIPGVGSLLGGLTMSVLSGASTFAVGGVFRRHLETGGTILDFDGKSLRKMYDDLFEKGREMASEMDTKAEQSTQATAETPLEKDTDLVHEKIKRIKELGQMLEQGLITQEEYITLKREVLGKPDVFKA
jgi:uncharacterized protein (DUF697 family)